MEKITQAIERAKASSNADTLSPEQMGSASQVRPNVRANGQPLGDEIMLSGPHLESKRIVAHDIVDVRSKAFDMLRTQVLQTMDMKSWQTLAITSPTAGCGKTVTAVNLALSITRLPDRPVLLVDLDLQNPKVADTFGLRCEQGVISVLEGRTKLSNAIVQARIRSQKVAVLPCETATLRSSEWMASRYMSSLMQEIKREFKGWTVILDLPPILTSDDVITILPQIDSVLFVVAAGTSTASQIKACNKHLETTPVVRIVFNKSQESVAAYYSGYSREQ